MVRREERNKVRGEIYGMLIIRLISKLGYDEGYSKGYRRGFEKGEKSGYEKGLVTGLLRAIYFDVKAKWGKKNANKIAKLLEGIGDVDFFEELKKKILNSESFEQFYKFLTSRLRKYRQ